MLRSLLLAVLVSLLAGVGARAADIPTFELVLKDHTFVPATLQVPANTRVRLVVKNQDATPAEFESRAFRAEKIVPAHGEVALFIGPLQPGFYGFFDEFHEARTRGMLVVAEP